MSCLKPIKRCGVDKYKLCLHTTCFPTISLLLSSPSNHQTYYAKMMPEFLNYAPGVRTYAEKNDVDSVHTGAVY